MPKRLGRTALYRLYDETEELLYIGISHNPDLRFGQHSQTKPWWSDVAHREVEWHGTRTEAADAEKAAIESERPRWNLHHAIRPLSGSDADDLFGAYRQVLEETRQLLPEVRDMAVRELRAGATVGQLAKLTGLTPEWFRRIAREEGVERLRPPTVGKLTPDA